MEEKIVILGNGFDLRHFLPTSYNHLISILCEIEKLPEDKESISFSDLFDGIFKEKNEWFYNQINNYYHTEKFIFNIEAIKSIQSRLEENSWFQYFKSVDENKIETWIDFETEIERTLTLVLDYFESFNNNLSVSKPEYSGKYFFISLSEADKFFKNKLQFHVLKSFKLFYLAPRLTTVYLDDRFILSMDQQIQNFKERDFFNFIYESLEEFVGIFNDYILFIINVFYKNLKNDKKENFILIGQNTLFQSVNQIFSFNYTSTFVDFYKFGMKARPLIDMNENQYQLLHGSANKDWENNLEKLKIVLGVDDIHDSLKNHKLFQFTKYFQKLHKQTDYLFLNKFSKNIRRNDNRVITFYFWGHSLDRSDRQYIIEIFNVVGNNYGCKIKIFYHSISAKGDQLKNLLGIVEKEKIERFMKNNILEFIESTPENLFKEL